MNFTRRVSDLYLVVAAAPTFSKEELEAALSKDGQATVSLMDGGKLTLGFPHDPKPHAHLDLYVGGREKYMRVRFTGNKVDPKQQEILRALRAAGMIDDSWKLRESGFYTPTPEELTFDFVTDKRNAFVRKMLTKMRFYHGTSNLDWEKIKKVGLMALDKSGADHGFESRQKHKGNEGVLYLAADFKAALGYADTRCGSVARKLKKDSNLGFLGDLYDPVFAFRDLRTKETFHVYPVVLEVEIPDLALLVADDDHVNKAARDIGHDLFKKMTTEQREKAVRLVNLDRPELKRETYAEDDGVLEMLWRETDEGFAEIMRHVPEKTYHEWFESLKSKGQVGYRGRIAPKFLKRLPTEYDHRVPERT